MKKIISLFQRNYDTDRLIRNEVVPGAEWVIDGEGVATQKLDGTCCLVKDGELWKRYEVKRDKTPPPGFVAANEVDEITGKQQGWVRVGIETENKWHREAYREPLSDGTYELVGPKVQGNPEHFEKHTLVPHGIIHLDAPRTYDELKEWFKDKDIEGIVWHHSDGRMVKIKKKDFGYKR